MLHFGVLNRNFPFLKLLLPGFKVLILGLLVVCGVDRELVPFDELVVVLFDLVVLTTVTGVLDIIVHTVLLVPEVVTLSDG